MNIHRLPDTHVTDFRNGIFLACALSMTLLALWAAREPMVAQVIAQRLHLHGTHRLHLHAIAHLGSYALLAFAWTCGLPRVPATVVAIVVAAFGLAQEALEVVGHGHAFEVVDFVVDAAGAVLGALLGRAWNQL